MLLLRLTLAAALSVDRVQLPAGSALALAFNVLEMLVGSLLAIGLWTPIPCFVQFAIVVALVTSGYEPSGSRELLGLVYLSLAALGPGAWSVDAPFWAPADECGGGLTYQRKLSHQSFRRAFTAVTYRQSG